MKHASILIPIGINCTPTYYLRDKGLRTTAYPFDWNITPINSALKLIRNGFEDYLNPDNLIWMPPEKRMLFAENGIDIVVSNDLITPVFCKRYGILYPHDFSVNGIEDLPSIREKYMRRAKRLLETLAEEKTTLLYANEDLNEWQIEQYDSAKVEFRYYDRRKTMEDFHAIKRKFPKTSLRPLKWLKRRKEPLRAIKRPLRQFRNAVLGTKEA